MRVLSPVLAIDATGQIVVMWRNWLGGSRDMYLARSRDGVTFSKPEKLGTGTWQINACPMDGGGLVDFAEQRRHGMAAGTRNFPRKPRQKRSGNR